MASGKCFVITGPDKQARDSFLATLRDRFVICNSDFVTRSCNDLELRTDDDMYFLVMPRSSRYNLWVVGDTSSMVNELQLMCGGPPQENVEKVFIVLYHDADVPGLFQEDMKLWWEDGLQNQLLYFARADQFISFNKDLNASQVNAIARFTGWKERITSNVQVDISIASQDNKEQTLESTDTISSRNGIGTALYDVFHDALLVLLEILKVLFLYIFATFILLCKLFAAAFLHIIAIVAILSVCGL